MGLAGDRLLHGYHCDCDNCCFGNDWPYRGQTDSSCSGEIISDVFDSATLGSPLVSSASSHIASLCEAAIDVDAEPGIDAGFHVHVFAGDLYGEHRENALYQFLRWEPTLRNLAGGRWAQQRDNNDSVRACVQVAWRDLLMSCDMDCTAAFTTTRLLEIEEDNNVFLEQFKHDALYHHGYADRHNNLNIRTNHGTWEFRLWNSTRVAWRMELFSGLSVALLDPNVVSGLAELRPPCRYSRPSTGLDNIALAVDNGGFARTAELIQRQATYLDERAGTAPSTLTLL